MKRSEVEEAAKNCINNHDTWMRAFPRAHEEAIKRSGFDPAKPDYSDPVKVVNFFHEFWNALPDVRGIRSGGFFDVCDIAECIFGFDDEDDVALPS